MACDMRAALHDAPCDELSRVHTGMSDSIPADHEFVLGRGAQSSGRLPDAVPAFQRAIEMDPDFTKDRISLGLALWNTGRDSEGQVQLNRAMARRDLLSEREAAQLDSVYHLLRDDYAAAISDYHRILTRWPADTRFRSNLAATFYQRGEYPRALEAGLRAAREHPHLVIPRSNVVCYYLATGDLEQVVGEARDVLEAFPHPPSFAYAFGAAASAMLGREGAATAMHAKLEKSEAASAVTVLADFALFEGRLADAVAALKAGITADEALKATAAAQSKWAMLAEALLRQGNLAAAREAAGHAAESPGHPAAPGRPGPRGRRKAGPGRSAREEDRLAPRGEGSAALAPRDRGRPGRPPASIAVRHDGRNNRHDGGSVAGARRPGNRGLRGRRVRGRRTRAGTLRAAARGRRGHVLRRHDDAAIPAGGILLAGACERRAPPFGHGGCVRGVPRPRARGAEQSPRTRRARAQPQGPVGALTAALHADGAPGPKACDNRAVRSARLLFPAVLTASLVVGVGVTGCVDEPPPLPPPLPIAAVIRPDELHLSDIVQLTFGGENTTSRWSWAGKQVVLQTYGGTQGCERIARVDAFASPPASSPVKLGEGPAFLPGDDSVVYARTPKCKQPPKGLEGRFLDPDLDLYRAKADGTGETRLTETPGYDAEASVCGKDGSIVFTSTRDGDLDLYRMDADGTQRQAPHGDGRATTAAPSSTPTARTSCGVASRPRGRELDDYKKQLDDRASWRPTTTRALGRQRRRHRRACRSPTSTRSSPRPPGIPTQKRVLFTSN